MVKSSKSIEAMTISEGADFKGLTYDSINNLNNNLNLWQGASLSKKK